MFDTGRRVFVRHRRTCLLVSCDRWRRVTLEDMSSYDKSRRVFLRHKSTRRFCHEYIARLVSKEDESYLKDQFVFSVYALII